MRLSELRRSLRTFGVVRTAADVLLRAINKVFLLHLAQAVVLERVTPGFPLEHRLHHFAQLDEATLRRCVSDPAYELTDEFIRAALARGDECYGLLFGDVLAAYAWYTRAPTSVGLPDLALHFSARFVHVYKGLTHPAHRGQRLHALGMAHALAHYRTSGARGLITYVDLTSYAAARSLRRVGYSGFGTLLIIRAFGRYFLGASRGCRRYQVELVSSNGATCASSG